MSMLDFSETPKRGKATPRRSLKLVLGIGVISGAFALSQTFASNIALNDGSNVEFGQGVAQTTACSNGESLIVTPLSSFTNTDGGGAFNFTGVTVSDIPESCEGVDFVISAYGATGDALPIFNETNTIATVYNNNGTFEEGIQSTGTMVNSGDGEFTVTFNSPVALSTNVMKVTLQSSKHTSWVRASIASGQAHTCTLLDTGAVKCWGFNEIGQLGAGASPLYRTTPVNVIGLSSGVSAISNRYDHTCALLNTGAVKCWGWGASGQLGDGTTTEVQPNPTDVSGLSSGVIAISTGNGHTCALLNTGAVKCWGGGGKTGDGTYEDRTTPVDVIGLSSGVSAISAAGYHTCALLNTGAVKCWGSDDNGTLGNGGGPDHSPGGNISGLSAGVIALAAGERHNCALLSTGGVQCWGKNENGQLGDGTLVSKNYPVTVSGISNAIAISAGFETSCALLSTGTVKCWGRNSSGQLGDGSQTQRLTPVAVSGLSSAVAISTGSNHNCALLSSGAAKCWGSNYWGQLGDGTQNDRLTPVSVTGIP